MKKIFFLALVIVIPLSCSHNKIKTTNMFGGPGKSTNGVYTKGIEGKKPPSVQNSEDMEGEKADRKEALKVIEKRRRKSERKRKRANRKRRTKIKKSKKKVEEEEEAN